MKGWTMAPSWAELTRHYEDARAAVVKGGHVRQSGQDALMARLVHVEFHKRLKRARIYVEEAA